MHIDSNTESVELEQNLTLRQEKFIVAYIETGNGAEAARRAGYSEHTARAMACENLTKPYLLKAIEAKRSELMKDSEEKVPVYLRQLEEEASNSDNNESARIRALEILLKANGAFIERKEVTTFDGSFLADLDVLEDDLDQSDPNQDHPDPDLSSDFSGIH